MNTFAKRVMAIAIGRDTHMQRQLNAVNTSLPRMAKKGTLEKVPKVSMGPEYDAYVFDPKRYFDAQWAIILVPKGELRAAALLQLHDAQQPFYKMKNVYTPDAITDKAYQGKGLMKALYSWVLDAGWCLYSRGDQSAGANQLWRSLAHSGKYDCRFVWSDYKEKTGKHTLYLLSPEDMKDPKIARHTRCKMFIGKAAQVKKALRAVGAKPFTRDLLNSV